MAIVVISTSVFFLFQNFSIRKSENKPIDPPVVISLPEQGTLKEELTINGSIESDEMVTVLPRTMGILESLHGDVGDYVTKGQVIARMDSELLKLNLRQADSALQFSKQNLLRITALYDQKITSLQNFDLAKTEYESMLSQYEMARLHYEYAEIKSPMNGVILKKHITTGSLASQQTPIFTIGTIGKLKISAQIPEKYYDIFNRRSEIITVTISRPEVDSHTYAAIIKTISPVISPESKNFEVTCDINNGLSTLRPGMFVRINFLLSEKKNIFFLPLATLIQENTAWIYDLPSKTAKRIPISLSFFNDLYYQIPIEIKDYFFIIEGQSFLRDGQTVSVLNKEILP